jgi:hypothetical protein
MLFRVHLNLKRLIPCSTCSGQSSLLVTWNQQAIHCTNCYEICFKDVRPLALPRVYKLEEKNKTKKLILSIYSTRWPRLPDGKPSHTLNTKPSPQPTGDQASCLTLCVYRDVINLKTCRINFLDLVSSSLFLPEYGFCSISCTTNSWDDLSSPSPIYADLRVFGYIMVWCSVTYTNYCNLVWNLKLCAIHT